jgi:hypothetical protein
MTGFSNTTNLNFMSDSEKHLIQCKEDWLKVPSLCADDDDDATLPRSYYPITAELLGTVALCNSSLKCSESKQEAHTSLYIYEIFKCLNLSGARRSPSSPTSSSNPRERYYHRQIAIHASKYKHFI